MGLCTWLTSLHTPCRRMGSLGIWRKWVVSFRPQPLYPRERSPLPPRYPVHRNLGVPQRWSERSGTEVSLAVATNQPAVLRASSPKLRHYPDSLPLTVCVLCFVLLPTTFVTVCCQVHNAKNNFAVIKKIRPKYELCFLKRDYFFNSWNGWYNSVCDKTTLWFVYPSKLKHNTNVVFLEW